MVRENGSKCRPIRRKQGYLGFFHSREIAMVKAPFPAGRSRMVRFIFRHKAFVKSSRGLLQRPFRPTLMCMERDADKLAFNGIGTYETSRRHQAIHLIFTILRPIRSCGANGFRPYFRRCFRRYRPYGGHGFERFGRHQHCLEPRQRGNRDKRRRAVQLPWPLFDRP